MFTLVSFSILISSWAEKKFPSWVEIQRNKFCLNKHLLIEIRCKKKRLCEKFINCYSVVINFKQIENDVFVNVEVRYIF